MEKLKTKYTCSVCGYETSKWWGICPKCRTADSFVEEVYSEKSKKIEKQVELMTLGDNVAPVKLSDVKGSNYIRFSTGIGEFDRVLGGGIVNGSLVLIGGDPGIGKSTILLQLTNNISSNKKVLYVSAEESLEQIKLRSDRIFEKNTDLLIMSQTNLEIIEKQMLQQKPDVVIIDSIQTISSTTLDSLPGSVSQVKDIANRLMKICKKENICCFIVGHVTKEGTIAGPRMLEHMVDTVLYFEGENQHSYRILRAVKNRFGSTNEIGIFEMKTSGLEDLANPSQMFLEERSKNLAGATIISTMEGSRPLLVEIQSLTTPTAFNNPRRISTGLEYNKLILLMAVLEKKAGYLLQQQDVYVKVSGGVKIDDPAVDLGVVVAVASSFKDVAVDMNDCFIGEVGLTGEVRRVSRIEQRINEAKKHGFKRVIVPVGNMKNSEFPSGIEIIPVKDIRECLDIAFGNVF